MLETFVPTDIVDIEDLSYTEFSVRPSSLNLNEGSMVFLDSAFTAIFYQTEKGRVRELIAESIRQPFIIEHDGLYFVDPMDNGRLYRLSLIDPDGRTLVVNDRVDRFVIIGNSVYYIRTGSFDIYRTSTDGGQSQKIT
jgi:hypothetical protein